MIVEDISALRAAVEDEDTGSDYHLDTFLSHARQLYTLSAKAEEAVEHDACGATAALIVSKRPALGGDEDDFSSALDYLTRPLRGGRDKGSDAATRIACKKALRQLATAVKERLQESPDAGAAEDLGYWLEKNGG